MCVCVYIVKWWIFMNITRGKVSGKVDKSNTYNRPGRNISFFLNRKLSD